MDEIREAIAFGKEAACRTCERRSCDICAWQEVVDIANRVDTVKEFLHEIDA